MGVLSGFVHGLILVQNGGCVHATAAPAEERISDMIGREPPIGIHELPVACLEIQEQPIKREILIFEHLSLSTYKRGGSLRDRALVPGLG